MRKTPAIRRLFFSAAVVLSVAAGARADEAAMRADLAKLEQQLAELRAENASLKAQLATQKAENAALKAQLGEKPAGQKTPPPTGMHSAQRVAELEAQNERLMRLAGVTPTGDLLDQAAARIVTTTDAATGQTTVTAPALALPVTHGSRSPHAVTFSYVGSGGSGTIDMVIDASDTRGLYSDTDTITVEVDGETFTCNVTDYEARKVRTGGTKNRRTSHREMVTINIPRDTARRIADGAMVAGQIGTTRFALERDQVAIVKALVMRADMLDGPTP